MADNDDLSIQVIDQGGAKHRLPALAGWSVMEIIRDAGLALRAECGGALSCATCHVYIDPTWVSRLPAPRDDEAALIIDHATAAAATSRLSCQILMRDDLNGLIVTLGPYDE